MNFIFVVLVKKKNVNCEKCVIYYLQFNEKFREVRIFYKNFDISI